jgi:hypothetical protein
MLSYFICRKLVSCRLDRQTGRQTGRQADRQTDRRTDRHTHTHTRARARSHTHTLSLSHTHSHTHTHTLSLSHAHTHTYTHTHLHTHTHTLSLSLTLTHTHTHLLTHTHTHTHMHPPFSYLQCCPPLQFILWWNIFYLSIHLPPLLRGLTVRALKYTPRWQLYCFSFPSTTLRFYLLFPAIFFPSYWFASRLKLEWYYSRM